jgi:signal transduction histidine kinase
MQSLTVKLVAAFLLVSLVGTGLVAGYIAYTTADRFGDYVAEQYRLQAGQRWADFYRITGSWQGVTVAMPLAGMRVMEPSEGPLGIRSGGRMEEHTMPAQIILVDSGGRVIVAGAGYRLDQVVSEEVLRNGTPISVGGRTVGHVIEMPMMRARTNVRYGFLANFYRLLGVGSIAATLVALVLGIVLARSLTNPVRDMTLATRAMARGELAQQIPVRSRDELGALAESFNQMSGQLVRARDARRQMTADIAHELRTPLSVILGHAEALSDGVLPPIPETLDIIYDEAQRLTRLVDDLRTLSLSDAGELALYPDLLHPAEILDRAAVAHSAQAARRSVRLVTHVSPDAGEIEADPDRVAQIVDNLVTNALRFSPEGGTVEIEAVPDGNAVRFSIRDRGPGIAPSEQALIFDRFHRTDLARNREAGGTGLGLAIARQLVQLHGGCIGVESTPGEGATFWFTLPQSGVVL